MIVFSEHLLQQHFHKYYKNPNDQNPNIANKVFTRPHFPALSLCIAFTWDLFIVYTAEKDSAPEIQGHDTVAYNQQLLLAFKKPKSETKQLLCKIKKSLRWPPCLEQREQYLDGTDYGRLILILVEDVWQELLYNLSPGETNRQSSADCNILYQ